MPAPQPRPQQRVSQGTLAAGFCLDNQGTKDRHEHGNCLSNIGAAYGYVIIFHRLVAHFFMSFVVFQHMIFGTMPPTRQPPRGSDSPVNSVTHMSGRFISPEENTYLAPSLAVPRR